MTELNATARARRKGQCGKIIHYTISSFERVVIRLVAKNRENVRP